jgi:uncharacterized protein (TIGR02001 family)
MRTLTLGFLAALTAAPALAQDDGWAVYGGTALEYKDRPDGKGLPSRRSLEAYVEAERLHFYGGVWAKFANDESYNEIDLYGGYRRDLDSGLSYDLSYYRYNYPTDSASNYGEVILTVGKTLGDKFYVRGYVASSPDTKLSNAYVRFRSYPADTWEIEANYGSYQNAGPKAEEEWDIGVKHYFTDETSLDLRYYNGTEYTRGYVGLFVSFDTTLLGG